MSNLIRGLLRTGSRRIALLHHPNHNINLLLPLVLNLIVSLLQNINLLLHLMHLILKLLALFRVHRIRGLHFL